MMYKYQGIFNTDELLYSCTIPSSMLVHIILYQVLRNRDKYNLEDIF